MASSGGDEYYNYEEQQYSQGWGEGSANADDSAWSTSGWDNGYQGGWNGEQESWNSQPWQEGRSNGDQSYDPSSSYGVSNDSGLGADNANNPYENTYRHSSSVPSSTTPSSFSGAPVSTATTPAGQSCKMTHSLCN